MSSRRMPERNPRAASPRPGRGRGLARTTIRVAILGVLAGLPAVMDARSAPAPAAAALVPAAPPQTSGEKRPAPADRTRAFEALGLTITLPEGADLLEAHPQDPRKKGSWLGTLGDGKVEIALYVLPKDEFFLEEPEDVTDLAAENLRRGGYPGFHWEAEALRKGSFGHAPYAHLARGGLRRAAPRGGAGGGARGKTSPPGGAAAPPLVGSFLCIGGTLERAGWVLETTLRPAVSDDEAEQVLDELASGVRYEGPRRDPKWTREEARARWLRDAPEKVHDKLRLPVLQTDHYVILTNSSGGKAFAKKMEDCYRRIHRVYPFDEVEGRRRMPVFLFRTRQEYFEYYAKIAGVSIEDARKSKGHSWRDYYATWYEAPNDPVHIHEATHQIFANRLRLGGAGSWFQEGVATYMGTTRNDRNVAANLVRKGRHVPLREFVAIPSLLYSASDRRTTGGSEAADHYKQAGLFIEFLCESRFGKAKFPAFLRAVGRLPANDVDAIDAAALEVYGTDLDGLDAAFVKYCKRR